MTVIPSAKIGVEERSAYANELLEKAKTRVEEAIRAFEADRSSLNDALGKSIKDIGGIKERAAVIEATLKDTAAQVGVAKHAQNFGEQADEHGNASRRWLGASVVLLLGVAAFATWVIFFEHPRGIAGEEVTKTAHAILWVGRRVLGLSVLITGFVWATRSYRSNRHNYVVNRHRQNALNTFQAFVEAAGSDSDLKSAVLLEAAKCIFLPQPSAYSSQGEGESSGTPQIIELVKNMTGGGGS